MFQTSRKMVSKLAQRYKWGVGDGVGERNFRHKKRG